MDITRDDILKLAKMARIAVADDEIDSIRKQMHDVLGYAERVCQIATESAQPQMQGGNVLREDSVHSFPAELVLAQAPQRDDGLFVVPHILQKAGDES